MKQLRPAEVLLQSLGITDPSEIDLEAIAWTQGARVRYRSLDGCEARIVGRGDQAIITVNSRSPLRRQRFSLAHELGHWKWHRGKLLDCRADDTGAREPQRATTERTADEYAADLLMPDYLFRPACKAFGKLNFKTITNAAEMFDVSLTAAAIRLVEIGHVPSMLVCHGPNGRKWFTRSPEVPTRWFPRDMLDADSFAFTILFGNEADDRLPKRIGADAWFDRFEAERYELLEQTVRTSKDETLTLLLIDDESMLIDQSARGAWAR